MNIGAQINKAIQLFCISIKVNSCASNPCQNGGTCVPNGNNTFTCLCDPEFVGSTCQTGKISLIK